MRHPCQQTIGTSGHPRSDMREGGFCATLFQTVCKLLILNGEMLERSIRHAWKLTPAARADAHRIPPTHFRSTTSPYNDVRRPVPVNHGVDPGFRGVCDTVLTQFADSLASYISMFLRTHRWERTATEPSRAGVDFVFPRTEGTICCKSENASAPVRQHSRCVRESPQHSIPHGPNVNT
jgi:hypothetical protein